MIAPIKFGERKQNYKTDLRTASRKEFGVWWEAQNELETSIFEVYQDFERIILTKKAWSAL